MNTWVDQQICVGEHQVCAQTHLPCLLLIQTNQRYPRCALYARVHFTYGKWIIPRSAHIYICEIRRHTYAQCTNIFTIICVGAALGFINLLTTSQTSQPISSIYAIHACIFIIQLHEVHTVGTTQFIRTYTYTLKQVYLPRDIQMHSRARFEQNIHAANSSIQVFILYSHHTLRRINSFTK